MENCIFCKIVKGEIPSMKIYEDSEVLAFLDIEPASLGHCLVIPKKHFESIFDIPKKELNSVMSAVQKISLKYNQEMNIDALNLIQSNGKIAEQDVPHFHIHIVPREKNDGISFWKNAKTRKIDAKEFYEKIKK